MSSQTSKDRAAAALERLKNRGRVGDGADDTAAAALDPAEAEQPPADEQVATVVEVAVEDVEGPEGAFESLSTSEQLFVEALVAGKTRAEAARSSGYEGARADCAGYLMFKRPLVRRAFEERKQQALEDAGVSLNRVLEGLAGVAFDKTVQVDNTAERLRAMETLLSYIERTGKSGRGNNGVSVADQIRQRFRKAKLRSVPNLKLIPGGAPPKGPSP